MMIANHTYSSYLDGLNMREPLWDGVRSLFNLFDNFDQLITRRSPSDDYQNILSDWQRVGGDIVSADNELNQH